LSAIYFSSLNIVQVSVGATYTTTWTRQNWLMNVHRSYQENVKQERHLTVAMRMKAEVNQITR